MQMDHFIKKDDSKALYGIAILLMIFHHCCAFPSRLGYNYTPVFGDFDIESGIAYFGKICVAVYAFITGYALAAKAEKVRPDNLPERFKTDVFISFRQLLRFYKKFWLVFLIFVPIGIAFFDAPYSPGSLIKGFFFGIKEYNGEWWYVLQYIEFLIVFPFLDVFLNLLNNKKTRIYAFVITVILLAAVFIFGKVPQISAVKARSVGLRNYFVPEYMIIFITAFLIKTYGVFEWADSTIPNNPAGIIITGCILVSVFFIRWLYVDTPRPDDIDVFITPFFVFSCVRLFNLKGAKRFVKPALTFLGTYSTYMWLVHTFWIYYYFPKVILLPKFSVLIFLWAAAISLLNAILLDRLQSALEQFILRRKSFIRSN